jgi:hypothetical protein
MRQITKRTFGLSLLPAMALAVSTLAVQAQTSQSSTSSSTGTTVQETQRGVPGTDVDVGTNRGTSRGVPGVDVDVGREGNQRNLGTTVDTRTSGASGDSTMAADGRARVDRN